MIVARPPEECLIDYPGASPIKVMGAHVEGFTEAIVAVARKLSVRISVVLMQQRPYEVRKKVKSAPLTQEETSPQGTTRREPEPGETNS